MYDSLRELEGEFLVRYMQNQIESEPPSDTEDDEPLLLEEEQKEEIAIKEPAGWSMSFGPSGLSLQAVTRNLNEYRQFIRSLSLQLARDFGQDCLPKQWDPDAEGYGEEAIEQDEVDEDEYLVTVQVDSIHTLFSLTDRDTSTQPEQDVTIDIIIPTFIQMHLPHMIEYLKFKYKQLKKKGQQPYHLVNIMLQLEPFLPTTTTDSVDTISMISIVMGYITAIHLLPPSPPIHLLPPLPDAIWQGCIRHVTLHLIELVLSHESVPYPNMLCILLLAWYEAEMNKRNDVWIELALRIIYQQPEQERMILPALIYLDCYSAIFQSRKLIFSYDIKIDEWNGTNEEEEGILLETKLMKLLQKVLLLFYQIEREEEGYKKIDVDEVLDLVKQIEEWENSLPEWVQWNNDNKKDMKMYLHMIHNIIKLLLFRPFTKISEEQTYTKTTFLDMSMISVDKLIICLDYNKYEKNWIKASKNLIKDVVNRQRSMFDQDEQIIEQVDLILNKLVG